MGGDRSTRADRGVRVGPRSSFRFVRRCEQALSTEYDDRDFELLEKVLELVCGSRKKQSVKELRCAGGVCLYGVVI